jgi:carbon monoxide dehydrogenase subunit G
VDKQVEDRVLISRQAENIYSYLSNPENHARFIPGMLEFGQTSPGAFARVGAQALGLREFFGVKLKIPYEITEVEPNLRLGMKGVMGPVGFEDGYVLEATGDSTLVTFWMRPTLTGIMRLARPFVLFVGRTHAAETLSGLKQALEGQPIGEHAHAS